MKRSTVHSPPPTDFSSANFVALGFLPVALSSAFFHLILRYRHRLTHGVSHILPGGSFLPPPFVRAMCGGMMHCDWYCVCLCVLVIKHMYRFHSKNHQHKINQNNINDHYYVTFICLAQPLERTRAQLEHASIKGRWAQEGRSKNWWMLWFFLASVKNGDVIFGKHQQQWPQHRRRRQTTITMDMDLGGGGGT